MGTREEVNAIFGDPPGHSSKLFFTAADMRHQNGDLLRAEPSPDGFRVAYYHDGKLMETEYKNGLIGIISTSQRDEPDAEHQA